MRVSLSPETRALFVAAWTLCILALGLVTTTPSARAQPLMATDVVDTSPTERERALPDAPEGFLREQRGEVRWEFPRTAESVAHELQELRAGAWSRITQELGGEIDGALTIRLARSPEEMRQLAPREAPPPAYASGVAYPRRGLILLTLSAPVTWERPDTDAIFVHELSHVALHRAARGHTIPRWFSEGVAIHQASERSLDRVQALWRGTVSGQLLPLSELSSHFPSQPHRVNLAYAQSADFVRWLLDREEGRGGLQRLLARVASGEPFEAALEASYAQPTPRLEMAWHSSLQERFEALPLLIGSGSLWVIAAALLGIAFVRRRRRAQEQKIHWERDELATLDAAKTWLATEALAQREAEEKADDGARELMLVVPPEPRRRDSGVPTVEHGGRNHTLH